MPDKEETLQEINNRRFKESLENQLKDIQDKRDIFEHDFYNKYTKIASAPECDKVLNENDISTKEQKGIKNGYSEADFTTFKEAINNQEVHDIRDMKLDNDQIKSLRATEYKKVFDKKVDDHMHKCQESMQELLDANSSLQELEAERQPLYDKIARYESEIADYEQDFEISEEDKQKLSELRVQKDKTQKEYDDFFESDPEKKEAYKNAKENLEKKKEEFGKSISDIEKILGPTSSKEYINIDFLKGFTKYEQTTKEMFSFLNGEPKVKEAKTEVKQSKPKVSASAKVEQKKEKRIAKQQEDVKVTEGKEKLDKYSKDAQKFAKKNWFARIFDRKGKANLAKQRNELKQQYGYTDTQLDIAKLGSKMNAKHLSKILNKAEKTMQNVDAIRDAIDKYQIKDKGLYDSFNEFVNASKTTEAPIKENKTVNRKSIVVNEAKDEKQSQKISVSENSKSLNLQKEKESNML